MMEEVAMRVVWTAGRRAESTHEAKLGGAAGGIKPADGHNSEILAERARERSHPGLASPGHNEEE
jgi:hypothetical protein